MIAYLNDYIGGVDDFVELSPDAPRLSLLEQPVSGHIGHPVIQGLLSLLSFLIPENPIETGLDFKQVVCHVTSVASIQTVIEGLGAICLLATGKKLGMFGHALEVCMRYCNDTKPPEQCRSGYSVEAL